MPYACFSCCLTLRQHIDILTGLVFQHINHEIYLASPATSYVSSFMCFWGVPAMTNVVKSAHNWVIRSNTIIFYIMTNLWQYSCKILGILDKNFANSQQKFDE